MRVLMWGPPFCGGPCAAAQAAHAGRTCLNPPLIVSSLLYDAGLLLSILHFAGSRLDGANLTTGRYPIQYLSRHYCNPLVTFTMM